MPPLFRVKSAVQFCKWKKYKWGNVWFEKEKRFYQKLLILPLLTMMHPLELAPIKEHSDVTL